MSKVRDIVIVSGFVIFTVVFAVRAQFAEDARREEVELRLAELEQTDPPSRLANDYDLLRQAAWEAQHPCGTGIVIPAPFYALNDFPQVFPEKNSKWCKDRAAEQIKLQASLDAEKLKMPVGDMIDCAYDYGGNVNKIDTVAEPQVHDSWVLGGSCEEVAHKLRDNELTGEVWNAQVWEKGDPELAGLCVSFTDDSPVEAHKCQTEMRRWIEVYCWNATEDGAIRQCRDLNLDTPTAKGKPFVP